MERVSFLDGRKTDFGGSLGNRTAYRFNFADQHILTRTLSVSTVSTRLCFDNPFVTRALAILKRIGMLKLLDIQWIRDFAVGRL